MSKKQKLKVGFAGARWLGIMVLKEIVKNPNLEVTNVTVPDKTVSVWWKDVVDENEVNALGFSITPWSAFKDLEFDILFSVLHGGIFKKAHLDNTRFGIINLHPAPLPEYRGCNSYSHAIMNGDKSYGVTLHYVDEGIDTGEIISIDHFPIYSTDTARTLYDRSQPKALALFKKSFPGIIDQALRGKKAKSTKQDEAKAAYYNRSSLEDKQVDLSWDQLKIERSIRGLDFPPFEPAYLILNNKKIHLTFGGLKTSSLNLKRT